MIAVHIFREIVDEFLNVCIFPVLNHLFIFIIDIFGRNFVESIHPFMVVILLFLKWK